MWRCGKSKIGTGFSPNLYRQSEWLHTSLTHYLMTVNCYAVCILGLYRCPQKMQLTRDDVSIIVRFPTCNSLSLQLLTIRSDFSRLAIWGVHGCSQFCTLQPIQPISGIVHTGGPKGLRVGGGRTCVLR